VLIFYILSLIGASKLYLLLVYSSVGLASCIFIIRFSKKWSKDIIPAD
jgi:hypothetical protein